MELNLFKISNKKVIQGICVGFSNNNSPYTFNMSYLVSPEYRFRFFFNSNYDKEFKVSRTQFTLAIVLFNKLYSFSIDFWLN